MEKVHSSCSLFIIHYCFYTEQYLTLQLSDTNTAVAQRFTPVVNLCFCCGYDVSFAHVFVAIDGQTTIGATRV